MRTPSTFAALGAAFLCAYIAMAAASTPPSSRSDASSPETLRAKHDELREALAKSAFHRPLHLDSVEKTEHVSGNVYARLDHPFARVREALGASAHWCEILVLPLHVRSCSPDGGSKLMLAVSTRPQPGSDAVELDFDFRVLAATPEHLRVQLTAREGPLGTRDYRLTLDAIPVDEGTFIHLGYSYGYGTAAALATQAYLATSGRDKVGFTMVEVDGRRRPVAGMRGILERNAMRYFLAIDAYLDSLATPPAHRLEKRLQAWAAALERYPRQLRETEPGYVAFKRDQMAAVARS